jgi:GNAT superfamily N-acetyltransferase
MGYGALPGGRCASKPNILGHYSDSDFNFYTHASLIASRFDIGPRRCDGFDRGVLPARWDCIRCARYRGGVAYVAWLSELGRVFLIYCDAEVAGYSIITFGFDLEYGGRLGILTDLYLRHPYRRRGAGSATLSALFELARQWNLSAILLQPERQNTAAVAFYQIMGFTAQDRVILNKRLEGEGSQTGRS